jgi:CheY-like chemotaxis protein
MAQILVVDDSATVRNEVGDFLKKNDLDVVLAVDGRDGLAKLKSDSAIKLVISDVNMPNMDGLTMAEKIRSELGNSNVNVARLPASRVGSSSHLKATPCSQHSRNWLPDRLTDAACSTLLVMRFQLYVVRYTFLVINRQRQE